VASFLHENRVPFATIEVEEFSSLSESGFIPTVVATRGAGGHLICSHLFQRVASFLLKIFVITFNKGMKFSSLSESGFIPTR